MTKHCADFGGISADGTPCRVTTTDGRCPAHDDEAVAQMVDAKAEFLELYSTGEHSARGAAAKVGRSAATVWRWRRVDEEFDQAVRDAQQLSDAIRVAAVEDTLFKRIMEETASPAEVIFFLKNRAPDRWKDKQHVQHGGDVQLHGVLRVGPVAESAEEWEQGAQAQQAGLVASKATLSLLGVSPKPSA